MGQILHKRSRTTEEIRKEIQESNLSGYKLAEKYNINRNTVYKWKNRKYTSDSKMGNGRDNSVLTREEDIFIVELRKKTWDSLDDLYIILKPVIPKLTRSNLHRCLQYYGVSQIPKYISNPNLYNEDGTKKKNTKGQGKFKIYELGFIHIDITDFWLDKKKYSLFVAIDRITKLSFAKIYDNKTQEVALDFLDCVFNFYPYKIHTVLTDNGLQFTYNALVKNKKPTTKRHNFTQKLLDNNIRHKTTKFFSPQTNGQVEKMNHIIKSSTLKLFHYNSIEELEENLNNFLNYYNLKKQQKALKGSPDFLVDHTNLSKIIQTPK